ncbi:hypothetical protein MASR1M32_42080 [Rhodobacter sp.]
MKPDVRGRQLTDRHVPLVCIAFGAADDKSGLGQRAADMAGGGVGGEGAAGGSVAGDLGHQIGGPEFGVLRGGEAVKEPGIRLPGPVRQGLAGVAGDHLQIDAGQGDRGASLPLLQEQVREGGGLGKGRMGAGHVLGLHREGLETGEAQGAGGARGLPDQGRGQQVQAGAEAEFGDMEPVAQAFGQAVAGQKDVARFLQPAGQREVGIVEPARDRHRAVAPVKVGCLRGVRHGA